VQECRHDDLTGSDTSECSEALRSQRCSQHTHTNKASACTTHWLLQPPGALRCTGSCQCYRNNSSSSNSSSAPLCAEPALHLYAAVRAAAAAVAAAVPRCAAELLWQSLRCCGTAAAVCLCACLLSVKNCYTIQCSDLHKHSLVLALSIVVKAALMHSIEYSVSIHAVIDDCYLRSQQFSNHCCIVAESSASCIHTHTAIGLSAFARKRL
jgi:hypothetical protein